MLPVGHVLCVYVIDHQVGLCYLYIMFMSLTTRWGCVTCRPCFMCLSPRPPGGAVLPVGHVLCVYVIDHQVGLCYLSAMFYVFIS